MLQVVSESLVRLGRGGSGAADGTELDKERTQRRGRGKLVLELFFLIVYFNNHRILYNRQKHHCKLVIHKFTSSTKIGISLHHNLYINYHLLEMLVITVLSYIFHLIGEGRKYHSASASKRKKRSEG